jgi:translation initiation factor 2A
MVQLDKRGPVYSVDWNSNSSQFAVVFGYMPAKACLFNLKCEPIFDYGTGPRNACVFNPHGNILCLAGTGNLRGNFEMWNVQGNKKISQSTIDDVTYFEWCSTGEHMLTATLAPRMNINNGFSIRNMLKDPTKPLYKFDSPVELTNAIFQPQASSLFPQPKLTLAPNFIEKKAEAYRPPSVRDGVYVPVKDNFQPPANQKGNENLSAAALKNKKKREAKARAKQEQEQAAVVTPTAVTAVPEPQSSGDPDIDKKVRAIRKKLKQINELKSKQKEGQVLGQNQLDKLNSEDSLLKELQSLQL